MADQEKDNREVMRLTREVGFEDFCSEATASFDDRFNEWHVMFFRFAYFHFFSRKIAKDRKEDALKQAFDYMQLIASHDGRLNICGVFLEGREDIRIYEQKNNYAEIRIAYSEFTKRWHWSSSYQIHYSGGGSAASISEDVTKSSEKTREEAILKACEDLYDEFKQERFTEDNQDAVLARAAREAIEKYVLDLLGRNAALTTPSFLADKKAVVQQSLF